MPTKPVEGSVTIHTLASLICKEMPQLYRADILASIKAMFARIEDSIVENETTNIKSFATFKRRFKRNLYKEYFGVPKEKPAEKIAIFTITPSKNLYRKLNND